MSGPAHDTLRYVVLHHSDCDQPHFDLMFEFEPRSDLLTWRSVRWPIDLSNPPVPIAIHRRAYLDYEGVISGGRGTVRRIETGMHVVIQNNQRRFTAQLEKGELIDLPK